MAIVYGGGNAAVDFGGGLEADHLLKGISSTAPEYKSATQDRHDAFHDAGKQAILAVAGAAGLMLIRRREE